MFDLEDTIAAISTPIGVGGIGIVRLSGRDAIEIVDSVFRAKKKATLKEVKSHTVHYGFVIDPESGERVDECIVTVMRAPLSYTRQDTVEINCHGGYQSLSRVLQLLIKKGARLAKPGEFTLRAFMNGRIDLSQAEAVMDLINSKTDQARQIAMSQLEGTIGKKVDELRQKLIEMTAFIEASIDFPEDDLPVEDYSWLKQQYETVIADLKRLSDSYSYGHILREGIAVAIVGKPNVGKSSLLNALLQKERAIVTDIAGTTRDVIEEYLNINGLPVRIIDTAGIRDSTDIIEREGVKRTIKLIESADCILALFDLSRELDNEDRAIIEMIRGKRAVVVMNKIDLVRDGLNKEPLIDGMPHCFISALTGEGINGLKQTLFRLITAKAETADRQDCLLTNERHKALVDSAIDSLQKAFCPETIAPEIKAIYIREATESLGMITGSVTTEEIIDRIFSRFCIGK